MKKTILCAAIIFSCLSSMAAGFLIGYSNLGFSGYPSFSSKSLRPTRPFGKDELSAKTYRDQLDRYIRDARSYIDACYNDIRTVENAAYQAQRDADLAISEYNNFINYGL